MYQDEIINKWCSKAGVESIADLGGKATIV